MYSPITNYPESFNVTSIPRTFLIDKSGNIVIDKNGAANWNSESVRNTIDNLEEEIKRLNNYLKILSKDMA